MKEKKFVDDLTTDYLILIKFEFILKRMLVNSSFFFEK